MIRGERLPQAHEYNRPDPRGFAGTAVLGSEYVRPAGSPAVDYVMHEPSGDQVAAGVPHSLVEVERQQAVFDDPEEILRSKDERCINFLTNLYRIYGDDLLGEVKITRVHGNVVDDANENKDFCSRAISATDLALELGAQRLTPEERAKAIHKRISWYAYVACTNAFQQKLGQQKFDATDPRDKALTTTQENKLRELAAIVAAENRDSVKQHGVLSRVSSEFGARNIENAVVAFSRHDVVAFAAMNQAIDISRTPADHPVNIATIEALKIAQKLIVMDGNPPSVVPAEFDGIRKIISQSPTAEEQTIKDIAYQNYVKMVAEGHIFFNENHDRMTRDQVKGWQDWFDVLHYSLNTKQPAPRDVAQPIEAMETAFQLDIDDSNRLVDCKPVPVTSEVAVDLRSRIITQAVTGGVALLVAAGTFFSPNHHTSDPAEHRAVAQTAPATSSTGTETAPATTTAPTTTTPPALPGIETGATGGHEANNHSHRAQKPVKVDLDNVTIVKGGGGGLLESSLGASSTEQKAHLQDMVQNGTIDDVGGAIVGIHNPHQHTAHTQPLDTGYKSAIHQQIRNSDNRLETLHKSGLLSDSDFMEMRTRLGYIWASVDDPVTMHSLIDQINGVNPDPTVLSSLMTAGNFATYDTNPDAHVSQIVGLLATVDTGINQANAPVTTTTTTTTSGTDGGGKHNTGTTHNNDNTDDSADIKEIIKEITPTVEKLDNLSPTQKQFLEYVTASAIQVRNDGAQVNPQIMSVQAVIESDWGQSDLATQGNNLFGMKAGSTWTGDTITFPTQEDDGHGNMHTVDAVFRAYPDIESSVKDYAYGFIGAYDRYSDARQHADDPLAYVQALHDAGYATDSAYVDKMMSAVKSLDLTEMVNEVNGTNTNNGDTLEQQILDYPGVNKIVSKDTAGNPLPDEFGNLVYYNEEDVKWANDPYEFTTGDGKTVGSSGCGPDDMAMIDSEFGDRVTPDVVAKWFKDNGYRVKDGTDHDAFAAYATAHGLYSQAIDDSHDIDAIKTAVQNGGYVIINGTDHDSNTPATPDGHLMVIRNVTSDGKFQISDPYDVSKSLVDYDPSDIVGPSSFAVAIYKTAPIVNHNGGGTETSTGSQAPLAQDITDQLGIPGSAITDYPYEQQNQLYIDPKTAIGKLNIPMPSQDILSSIGSVGIDRMYVGQCTWWGAWRVANDSFDGSLAFSGGVDNQPNVPGSQTGDAYNWAGDARAVGYTVDDTPAVGSILAWDLNGVQHGTAGHVAYVEKVVKSDNGSIAGIIISQFNATDHTEFSVVALTPDQYNVSTAHFIHTEDGTPKNNDQDGMTLLSSPSDTLIQKLGALPQQTNNLAPSSTSSDPSDDEVQSVPVLAGTEAFSVNDATPAPTASHLPVLSVGELPEGSTIDPDHNEHVEVIPQPILPDLAAAEPTAAKVGSLVETTSNEPSAQTAPAPQTSAATIDVTASETPLQSAKPLFTNQHIKSAIGAMAAHHTAIPSASRTIVSIPAGTINKPITVALDSGTIVRANLARIHLSYPMDASETDES